MSLNGTIDLLTATAHEIQLQLTSRVTTSELLVPQYLEQINKYNPSLRLMLELAPVEMLLSQAKELDAERENGHIRGLFHGVPIIVKDNFVTSPEHGLKSTAGSFAFMDLKRAASAKCVQQLVDAGCIVLGKSNLSEFSNFKGIGMPCGWSARGGQTQSPYVKGGWDPKEKFGGHSGPGGSSSGSAAAVAAGFAPLALGTETWGSLIMPATRGNVFTIKPSRGLISQDGIFPISEIFDVPGPIAKSAIDIANALDVMAEKGESSNLASNATGLWGNLKLGAVNTSEWKLDPWLADPDEDWFKQQDMDIASAYRKIQELGVNIKFPISFPERGPLGDVLVDLINHNFVRDFDKFLAGMDSTITTIEQLVKFNDENADIEMPPESPNQDTLLGALKAETWSEKQNADRLAEGVAHAGPEGIDRVLADNDIDIILGPADSWLTDFACVAGYPSAMLPLSVWKKNGRPFGVIALTGYRREDLLVQLMSAWEKYFPVINPPTL